MSARLVGIQRQQFIVTPVLEKTGVIAYGSSGDDNRQPGFSGSQFQQAVRNQFLQVATFIEPIAQDDPIVDAGAVNRGSRKPGAVEAVREQCFFETSAGFLNAGRDKRQLHRYDRIGISRVQPRQFLEKSALAHTWARHHHATPVKPPERLRGRPPGIVTETAFLPVVIELQGLRQTDWSLFLAPANDDTDGDPARVYRKWPGNPKDGKCLIRLRSPI